MENLYLEGTHDIYYTPTVDFNARTGECSVLGESFLEDAVKFYTPLFDWLEEYKAVVKRPIIFNIKLTYYNTSTSKCLLKILDILKDYELNGGTITMNWYFNDNEIDEEDIDDFMNESGVKINKFSL